MTPISVSFATHKLTTNKTSPAQHQHRSKVSSVSWAGSAQQAHVSLAIPSATILSTSTTRIPSTIVIPHVSTHPQALSNFRPSDNFSQIPHILSWLHSAPQRFGTTIPYQSQASLATAHGPTGSPGPLGWQIPTTFTSGYNQTNNHWQTSFNRLGTPYTFNNTQLTGTGALVPP